MEKGLRRKADRKGRGVAGLVGARTNETEGLFPVAVIDEVQRVLVKSHEAIPAAGKPGEHASHDMWAAGSPAGLLA